MITVLQSYVTKNLGVRYEMQANQPRYLQNRNRNVNVPDAIKQKLGPLDDPVFYCQYDKFKMALTYHFFFYISVVQGTTFNRIKSSRHLKKRSWNVTEWNGRLYTETHTLARNLAIWRELVNRSAEQRAYNKIQSRDWWWTWWRL